LPLFIFAHFGHHVVGAMLRPLMPMIRTDFDLSYTQVGYLISAFAVTSGIAQLPAGWLADRFGARIMVAVGVSGVAIAGLLVGLSQSFISLIIFLIIAAILGGGYHPASSAAISTITAPERRGRALGIHLIGGSSSFWVIPLLAAPIAAAWGWRASYITLAIPVILLGILLYILIGKRTVADAQKIVKNGEETNPATEKIRWRQILPVIIMSVSMGTMIQSIGAYFSLYAVDYFGLAEAAAAMLVAISPAVGLFAAPMGGYMSDRFGELRILTIVGIIAIPTIYILGVIPNIAALAVILFVIGVISNTRMPTSESYIIRHVPASRRSTILGFYFFAGAEISGLLAPLIGNSIDTYGFQTTFTIVSIALLVIVIICLFFIVAGKYSKKYPDNRLTAS